MRIYRSILALTALVFVAALLAGCSGTPGTNVTTGTPATTAPTSGPSATQTSVTGALTPETVLPDTVPGFDFLDKTEREEGIYEGEEYFVSAFFVPSPGSKYENKTDILEVDVGLFSNATAASAELADYGSDISIDGVTGKYYYDKDFFVSSVAVVQGDLFIETLAQGIENMSPSDEPILQDSAVQGAKAALQKIP